MLPPPAVHVELTLIGTAAKRRPLGLLAVIRHGRGHGKQIPLAQLSLPPTHPTRRVNSQTYGPQLLPLGTVSTSTRGRGFKRSGYLDNFVEKRVIKINLEIISLCVVSSVRGFLGLEFKQHVDRKLSGVKDKLSLKNSTPAFGCASIPYLPQ
ncbi:hypothetical protein DPEC_G00154940 [Dallia pectoralis]|uniref:Uncharacterized protein n=1 Tax=Dallia pectoralis TaxID=75939 RepID=A0ACC2GKC7_DALPE|nr:hypothetical protein DPEC_G00154940 [Dallia pectoralis]